jgi:L-ascorbate metabolism protein UlaG (beta-lactamase superfamily)
VGFVRHVLLPQLLTHPGGATRRPNLEAPVPQGAVRVTWIGHATFLIQYYEKNVLIDPNWAQWHAFIKRVRRPGVALEHLPRIDLVLVTHAHFDHLQLRSLHHIAGGQPIVVPRGVAKLVRRRGFGQIFEVSAWDTVNAAGLEITFTPSKHWGARVGLDVEREFGGFRIAQAGGQSVYHCGDSAYFEGFREIGQRLPVDLALMPIGAYGSMSGRNVHMNPEEAVRAFEDLGARHLVPMHYGTFPLGCEPMHEPLERLHTEIARRGWQDRLTVLTEGLPWIYQNSV